MHDLKTEAPSLSFGGTPGCQAPRQVACALSSLGISAQTTEREKRRPGTPKPYSTASRSETIPGSIDGAVGRPTGHPSFAAFDWSTTAIGSADILSSALRMMIHFLLANRLVAVVGAPQYVLTYNDAYRPVLGTKHPWALGQPLSECWNEIWHILQPLVDTAFKGGPATWNDDILLEINRHGFVEETHFTIAYSPVPDEDATSGIGGVLATVHEITEKVVGERRISALRDLGAATIERKTAEEACLIAADTLAKYTKDIPFASLNLLTSEGQRGLKHGRACDFRTELDLQTLVCTRGRGFPLALLASRLKCPRCGCAQWPCCSTLRRTQTLAAPDSHARKRRPRRPEGYQGLMRRMGEGDLGDGGTPPGIGSKTCEPSARSLSKNYFFRPRVQARPGMCSAH